MLQQSRGPAGGPPGGLKAKGHTAPAAAAPTLHGRSGLPPRRHFRSHQVCPQAEKKRIEKLNKGMAERTIDAQRVSGESCRGRVLHRRQLGACKTSHQTPSIPRPAATVPRDTVQLYQQLRESGLQYGPAFRCAAARQAGAALCRGACLPRPAGTAQHAHCPACLLLAAGCCATCMCPTSALEHALVGRWRRQSDSTGGRVPLQQWAPCRGWAGLPCVHAPSPACAIRVTGRHCAVSSGWRRRRQGCPGRVAEAAWRVLELGSVLREVASRVCVCLFMPSRQQGKGRILGYLRAAIAVVRGHSAALRAAA